MKHVLTCLLMPAPFLSHALVMPAKYCLETHNLALRLSFFQFLILSLNGGSATDVEAKDLQCERCPGCCTLPT